MRASLRKVWGILGDVARMPEWVDGVKECERTGAVKEGQGLRWRESCVLDRQHIEAEHEMSVWEPMKKAVIQSKLPHERFDDTNPSLPGDAGRGSRFRSNFHGISGSRA